MAAYRSLVRPGFNESRASLIINVEDNEIEGGNPLLDPITAWNFDIGYEKYFGPESAAGFGFFYKKLEDAIYEVKSDNIVVIGQTWDQAKTYINSGESTISGFEIFGQTAWDNGIFVATNITLSDSESDLPADSVAGNRAVPYVKMQTPLGTLPLAMTKVLGTSDLQRTTEVLISMSWVMRLCMIAIPMIT